MKSRFTLATAVCLTSLLWCATAWAMTLQEAKTARLVGEQSNGYLGVVIPSPETQQLVLTVNAKRKHYYQIIADRNNISLDKVATLAAQKAIEAAETGHMIQTPQGKWLKK
ncbi:YdbL family protein [Shewanella sp. SG41-4]|uniref:YdbL family protein n=1 Tax=Shewanella sp. SG41-4 TaxID=2760976 RepID=UPI0016020768|nr:YdbL family protein [Shewanella sp. SG41-4]MBB1438420.1 YdbL family protein [Shewanella sp. SG41-4]